VIVDIDTTPCNTKLSLEAPQHEALDPSTPRRVAARSLSHVNNGSSTPATTLTTSAFTSGGVGLYDFSAQTFDNFVLSTVPEPSSLALISLGMAGSLASLALLRRKSS
jgi:hypothetical protein